MHLIVSVAQHSYVALAKGGVTEDHVLVLPIVHVASSVDAPDEVLEEMFKYALLVCLPVSNWSIRYIAALRKMYSTSGQQAVMYERALGSSRVPQHMQFQVSRVYYWPNTCS